MPNQHPKALCFLCSYSSTSRNIETLDKNRECKSISSGNTRMVLSQTPAPPDCEHSGHSDNKPSRVPNTNGQDPSRRVTQLAIMMDFEPFEVTVLSVTLNAAGIVPSAN